MIQPSFMVVTKRSPSPLSIATMLFGLTCGGLLRSQPAAKKKLKLLAFACIGSLLSGWLLDALDICTIVIASGHPSGHFSPPVCAT
jgi:hypothetical protein